MKTSGIYLPLTSTRIYVYIVSNNMGSNYSLQLPDFSKSEHKYNPKAISILFRDLIFEIIRVAIIWTGRPII